MASDMCQTGSTTVTKSWSQWAQDNLCSSGVKSSPPASLSYVATATIPKYAYNTIANGNFDVVTALQCQCDVLRALFSVLMSPTQRTLAGRPSKLSRLSLLALSWPSSLLCCSSSTADANGTLLNGFRSHGRVQTCAGRGGFLGCSLIDRPSAP